MEKKFSEEFLEGYNQGYQEAEEDFLSGTYNEEFKKEELDIEFNKGKEEGIKECMACLRQILNDYSTIDCGDDKEKALLVRNQILAIKYGLDFITSKKDKVDFDGMPWL